MTELESGVAGLLANLRLWSALPKYSVERRLDLFLAPFIPMYLGDKLGCPGQVELVVPEFPIRHGSNYQTVNADYLLFRRDVPTWFLVELKTDATSVDDDQAAIYATAATPRDGQPAFTRLLDNLPLVRKRSKGRALKAKYDYLIDLLTPRRAFELAPVQVFYVSPAVPTPEPWRYVRPRTLAAWTPREGQALWSLVAPILVGLGDGAPAKGTMVPWHRQGMGPSRVERIVRDREGRWIGVELSYQAGCIVMPDPDHPGRHLGPPMGGAYVDRDTFLAEERRYDEVQWTR